MDRNLPDARPRVARLFEQLLSITVVMVAALYLLPAQAQTISSFGKRTIGTIPSAGLNADFKRASRFTLTEGATVAKVCAYLDGNGGVSGTQFAQFALYADANGVPGKKVLETGTWLVTAGDPARWACVEADHLAVIPAGQYWIAILTSRPGGIIRDFYDGPANWYGNADTFQDGPASSFGGGSTGSGTVSAFVRYYPESQLTNAGRTTIGSLLSKGMTADFKRASSFVMPQPGKLFSMTAYLDGTLSTNLDDVAPFRYALYKDASGVPGAKIYEGRTMGVRGTWAPSWTSDFVFPSLAPTLDAGRYWFTIHTGAPAGDAGATATAGFIRNFADGTGNWYGNNDAFTDGASSPFGAGNTGNGTITAYISYRPGTITTGDLGRHEIAMTPSRALDPDVMRWSSFSMQDRHTTLTGLHAYLDGLGATSGSQAVRMVLYGFRYSRNPDGTSEEFYYKVAESDVVTISAGMQPQWVSFPVASVAIPDDLPPDFLVGIQSGGPNAVVRDYGDDVWDFDPGTNWFSRPDAFADGAADVFSPDDPPWKLGNVTLSVYASYSLPPP